MLDRLTAPLWLASRSVTFKLDRPARHHRQYMKQADANEFLLLGRPVVHGM